MRTVARALEEIMSSSAELSFGFSRGLFNLSQLARFIRPMVEARTHKEVQESSLVMALSRRSRAGCAGARVVSQKFKVESVSVLSNLVVMTLQRSDENHRAVDQIYSRLKRKNGFLTISEGSSEITLICQAEHRALVVELLPTRPTMTRDKIAALAVRFHPKFLDVPGLLYKILEQIALQGINVVELASTATELSIYIKEGDIRLGFDTILRAFME
ncbi:MAG: hypothetical protein EBZ48_09460 [Proteobacteria bacterium]|nr:hypothetical protein [Pseudomonadota bacterium]